MRASLSTTSILLLLLAWLPAQEPADNNQTDAIEVNPSGETKIFHDLHIPEGEVRSGAIRVVGGNLTVAGTVTDRITVLGGDVELLPTAKVEGTIVAIGGTITRSDQAEVTGQVLEVNRGKISLSREEADKIFDYDESRDERIGLRDRVDDEWDTEEVTHDVRPSWRSYSRRKVRPDFEVFKDVTLRYNRAEGLALYIPFNPDTDDIPGFHVFGYVGRAFMPGTWYGRLGIGEYLFRGRLGLLVEGHKEPHHDDGWRISSLENSLGAFLLHKDWHDWYETEGYGGSLVLAQPGLAAFKVRYRDEEHRMMPSATSWDPSNQGRSLTPEFAYAINDTLRDINLRYQISLGHPAGYFPRRIEGQIVYAYTQTAPGSEDDNTMFDYTREDITLEAFVPLHRRLGIRVNARTGTIKGDRYGLQHLVPLGGVGSVQGYGYKAIDPENHYAMINTTISLRNRKSLLSLSWHFGNTWDSGDRLLTGDYFNDLTGDGYHSIGLSVGDDHASLALFRSLQAGGDWIFYFRLLDY
ncbi:MAG: hypothetical protein JSW54_00990 [Fidelibacterota bacterium]|nr:MAG: hypothetical protein JSW54_00990 [Candidatus Neomarinimicrobiota bacterium]